MIIWESRLDEFRQAVFGAGKLCPLLLHFPFRVGPPSGKIDLYLASTYRRK
jgi:hypothetical protein